MSKKTCCITGHRDIPRDKLVFVKKQLDYQLSEAIADGYTVFLSGFAEGADLLFAQLVIAQKEQHPNLFLEAAIPYRNRLKTANPLFQICIKACNEIHIQQEQYSNDCFLNRNRYLVSSSSRVIAVYDGRPKGGTLFTMRCAHTLKKELRVIRI